MKKALTIIIFLALLGVSVFLAYWYYNKYMKSPKSTTPAPGNSTPPPSNTTTPPSNTPPSDNNTDPDIGKEAYAATVTTLYDLTLSNTIKTLNPNDDIGKVTGVKDIYFIIDGQYLVSKGSVITR